MDFMHPQIAAVLSICSSLYDRETNQEAVSNKSFLLHAHQELWLDLQICEIPKPTTMAWIQTLGVIIKQLIKLSNFFVPTMRGLSSRSEMLLWSLMYISNSSDFTNTGWKNHACGWCRTHAWCLCVKNLIWIIQEERQIL